MIDAGLDVVRLNMSHADHPTAKETFERIRRIDDTIAIMLDLQGPKIRIGKLKAPTILTRGQEFILSTDSFVGDAKRVSVSFENLPQDVKPGDTIAINDGIIRLRVTKIQGTEVVTVVKHGGPISNRKGVNIPGIKLSCSAPTEEDIKDVEFAAELEPDFFALSFVMERDDIVRLRGTLEANGLSECGIISKIEHILAIENYDAILKESDGVMIARGDLGIEVPIEDVPILQRDLIHKANVWAKPAIVAKSRS
jgi:pyruvate kinase